MGLLSFEGLGLELDVVMHPFHLSVVYNSVNRDKAQGSTGRVRLNAVPCQPSLGSSLALFGVASQIVSASARAGAELGCVWVRGVSSSGFMAAGAVSFRLLNASGLCCCQPGSRVTNHS